MTTKTERRIRIGDWLVPYDDAKKAVQLNRTMKDVLTAKPGSDTDCMNSRCIRAQRNERVFPHPVFIVSTIKSRVYIVDKLDDDGMPSHAVRYELSEHDSRLIREHDEAGVGEPGLLQLRVPRDPKGSPHRATYPGERYGTGSPEKTTGGKRTRNKRPVTARGASARIKVAVGALRD